MENLVIIKCNAELLRSIDIREASFRQNGLIFKTSLKFFGIRNSNFGHEFPGKKTLKICESFFSVFSSSINTKGIQVKPYELESESDIFP